ncbi:FecR family protein [Pendulispora rubella]|uniref:FecR family protein n=1 Tax=Pendulispora rubella TaxID=2741070 RepID=A0ABZ2L7D1_9BACT
MIEDDDLLRGDRLDLEAWQPGLPPPGFVDTVMARVEREPQQRRKLWLRLGAVSLVASAAAVAMLVGRRDAPPWRGELAAKERTEMAIAGRAWIVIEPGTHLRWEGKSVTQDDGDVFYRVDPGGPFRVRTPAGDVAVRGTCFRVKVTKERALPGRDARVATPEAMAFVGVYEGRVTLTHGATSIGLAAGEGGELDGAGPRRTGDLEQGMHAFDLRTLGSAEASSGGLSDVRKYALQLETLEGEKALLEERLATATQRLAATSDGGINPNLAFDLSADDWKELARSGSLKFRMPCLSQKPWSPSPEERDELGLSPNDGKVIEEAYRNLYERVWGEIRPLCVSALNAEVADKLGPMGCGNALLSVASSGPHAHAEARLHVAEMRAGFRPLPSAGDARVPVLERVLLSFTGRLSDLETDLARSFGPQEARRLVYSDAFCAWNESWAETRKSPSRGH